MNYIGFQDYKILIITSRDFTCSLAQLASVITAIGLLIRKRLKVETYL